MGRVLLASQPTRSLNGYLDGVHLDRLTSRTIASLAAFRSRADEGPRTGLGAGRPGTRGGTARGAAPIRDRAGRVVAAVNISAHASRASLESMRRDLVPPLLATAARISADLPYPTRKDTTSRNDRASRAERR
jgi:IclR family pca regulon transcriptional regulator